MKKYLIKFFCIPNGTMAQKKQKRQIHKKTTFTFFGNEISKNAPKYATSIYTLIAEVDSMHLVLRGGIEATYKTYKMKGYWMSVKTGDSSSMRVTFKDYGLFIPKRRHERQKCCF